MPLPIDPGEPIDPQVVDELESDDDSSWWDASDDEENEENGPEIDLHEEEDDVDEDAFFDDDEHEVDEDYEIDLHEEEEDLEVDFFAEIGDSDEVEAYELSLAQSDVGQLQFADGPDLKSYLLALAQDGAQSIVALPPLVGRRSLDEVLIRPSGVFSSPPDVVSTSTIIGGNATRPLELGVPICLRVPLGLVSNGRSDLFINSAESARAGVCFDAQGAHGDWPRGLKSILSLAPGTKLPSSSILAEASAVELWLPPLDTISIQEFDSDDHVPLIRSAQALGSLIERLRGEVDGAPIGVRLLAADIETDLAQVLEAGPDFVILTGRGSSVPFVDRRAIQAGGLPIFHGLSRARAFLDTHSKGVSLIASGGLRLPLDVGIALALGADAVELATVPSLAFGGWSESISANEADQQMKNVVGTYVEQLMAVTRQRGLVDVHALSQNDLCSPLAEVAKALQIQTL